MAEEVTMTLIEHLEELRRRLIWSLAAVAVCFAATYNFSKQIFNFLMKPVIENLPKGSTLIFTKPAEGFTTYLKVALFAALVLALPFILYQTWRFIAPALYKHEKQIAIPFVFFGVVFFAFCLPERHVSHHPRRLRDAGRDSSDIAPVRIRMRIRPGAESGGNRGEIDSMAAERRHQHRADAGADDERARWWTKIVRLKHGKARDVL